MSATTTSPAPAARPLLIDLHTVSLVTGLSVRSLERLLDSGRLPRPIRIGRSRRWRIATIEAWVAQDCPAADRFEDPTTMDGHDDANL